jgi:hypothetical protein
MHRQTWRRPLLDRPRRQRVPPPAVPVTASPAISEQLVTWPDLARLQAAALGDASS